jgi:hypothetical protein
MLLKQELIQINKIQVDYNQEQIQVLIQAIAILSNKEVLQLILM